MKKYRFLATILVVLTGLIMTSNALASGKTASAAHAASTTGDLYRFIPSGIDPISDTHATQQVMAYAKKNPAYGQALASQTGDTRFAPAAYKADGYRSHAPKGSTNSAAGAGGQVVGTADHGNSASVKVVAILNIHTMQVAYVMVRCGNLRLLHVTPIPWKPIHLGVSATINRLVKKKATVTCLSGQKVTGYVTTRVKGVIYARTRGKVKGWAKIWLRQQADLQIRTVMLLKCGPAPTPPKAPTPPPAGSCNANNSPGAVVCSNFYVIVTCGGAQITINGATQQEAIQNANNYVAQNCTSSPPPCNCTPPPPVCPPGTSGTPPTCNPLPLPPSVTITSTTTLNDIPEGKNSGPFYYSVNASAAGSFTVDPGNGGISSCTTSTPQYTPYSVSLSAGINTVCVVFYAPTDTSSNSMTITATAIVTTSGGTAKDVKGQTFNITHPVRPPS